MELSLHNLDYVAVGVYVLLMAAIGIIFGLLVKDSGSYFKGNGAIPWVMATITNFMGLFSTFVFVAYAGIAYTHGIISITVFWSTVPACILCGLLMGKRWRRTGNTSPMEYLEERYNIKVHTITSWVGLAMRFLENMVRLYAIGIFITAITPLSLEWSIVVAGLVCVAFNVVGGIWTVSIMSTVQFIILMLITIVLFPLSMQSVGGLDGIAAKLPEHLNWFNGPKGEIFWLSVYYLMTIIKYNENWTFIQKFYCVKDEKAATKVGVWTGIAFLVCTPLFLLPAVAGPILVPDIADPEMSYVALSSKLLPVGLMGILFSSMFAATMSSLNSEYNIMANVITLDIYKKVFRPKASDKELLNVARISTAALGIIMIGGAILIRNIGGAFEANKLFSGILAIPLGIPLICGILFRRPNSVNAMLTIIVGVAAGVILNCIDIYDWIPAVTWEVATLLEIIICFVVYFIPLKRSAEKDELVNSFFTKMATPIAEKDKPQIAPGYKNTLTLMFAFCFLVSGILFISMSLPSISTNGGLYGFISGIVCLIATIPFAVNYRKSKRKAQ